MNSFSGNASLLVQPDTSAAQTVSVASDICDAADQIKAVIGALRESFAKMVVTVQQAQAQIGNNTRQMVSSAVYLHRMKSFFRAPSRAEADSANQLLVRLDMLRQRLVEEELGFWQSRLALTRSGSEEQMQVAQQTYRFLAQFARESMIARAADVDDKGRIADLGSWNELQMVEAEQKLGNLSASETLAQEQQLLRETWALDERTLAARKELGVGGGSMEQQTEPDEAEAYFSYLTQQEKLIHNAAAELPQSWESAFKSISDQLAIFSTEVITHTKSIAKAFDELMRSIIDDSLKASFRSFFNNLLGIGGTGSSGGGSGLLGGLNPLGLLGSAIGELFKSVIGATLGAAIGNPLEEGAGGLFGGSLAGTFGNALGSGIGNTATAFSSAAGGALGFGGGLLAKLGSMLPAAAGGWDIPHFAQGGVLSIVHGGEMVLPRDISDGLRGAIAGGSFGGGHTINISAVDAAGVARLFRQHGHELLAGLNSAVRHGGAFSPAT